MNSQIAIYMDSTDFLQMNLQAKDVIDRVEEEYGVSSYGSIKYSKNELYRIGYVYRFFSFTYELSTLQVYKLVKPKELRELFLPYHTMDPSQAIERILEAKGLFQNEEKELQRQFEIYKKIRFII
ncbi:MAG: antitoxin [Spirochaetales bacterium]|nr:antitoxin [Spirochaetales bacterium]